MPMGKHERQAWGEKNEMQWSDYEIPEILRNYQIKEQLRVDVNTVGLHTTAGYKRTQKRESTQK